VYNYDNIEDLPLIIFTEKPEQVNFRVNSLIKKPINIDKLKPSKVLNNNFINSLSELNYYNNTNIATSIEENLNKLPILSKYHGISNIVDDTMFRFSGDYMPLFYEIDIFKKDNTIAYNELQLIFYTDIDDSYVFTFTKDDLTIKETFFITTNNYYDQVINLISNNSLFSGADFIFEVLPKGSNYINDVMDPLYDVLSIKYKSSYGNIKISVTQLEPILLFDIENSSSGNNITFILSATAGHPPYQYSFGYTSGTTVVTPSAFSSTATYSASKSGAVSNGDAKMIFEIYEIIIFAILIFFSLTVAIIAIFMFCKKNIEVKKSRVLKKKKKLEKRFWRKISTRSFKKDPPMEGSFHGIVLVVNRLLENLILKIKPKNNLVGQAP
jgi:hypothetical protein